MKPRASVFALPLALSACAAHHWTHPTITDPLLIDQDSYACMKENSFVAGHVESDKHGVRADQVTKVDQQLFQACMRARGYAWSEVEKEAPEQPPYLKRAARSQGLVLEAETAFGGTWSAEREATADFTPLASDMGAAPDVRSASVIDAELAPSLRFGAIGRLSPNVDLGGRVGVRSAGPTTYVDTRGDGVYVDSATNQFDSALGVDAAVIARLRPDAAPRLFAAAEVGVTNVPPVPVLDEKISVENDSTGERTEASIHLDAEPWALVPYLRVGLGLDLIHPDPLGLAFGCSADVALRPTTLVGDSTNGNQVTADCALTLRLSPARIAPAP